MYLKGIIWQILTYVYFDNTIINIKMINLFIIPISSCPFFNNSFLPPLSAVPILSPWSCLHGFPHGEKCQGKNMLRNDYKTIDFELVKNFKLF